jgi:sterol 3beta-glucosyltransferase
MLITILAAGTRGDTQPYIALGLALKKDGNSVRIAAFENFKRLVEDAGLEFFPIKGDVSRVAASAEVQTAHQADNPLKILLSFNKLKSLIFDVQQDMFAACAGAGAIVYHPGAAIGFFAAQSLNVPSIMASPFPMTPTTAYPSLIFYDAPRLGKRFNRVTHQLFEKIMWFASSASVKAFWKQRFGRAPQPFAAPYRQQATRRLPTIVSCSEYVFPRPADWPQHVYNTGYWFVEGEENWQPPADLHNFLQSGPPPVYVGFGSVGEKSLAAHTTALVISSLQNAGLRGVLATGWSGMQKPKNLPEDFLFLDSAPHTWLFPRMAAVVHHGGAGTTAAGFRSGVPSVIIPHSNDQFAWARRVHELGVGPKPIPRKHLTAENLAAALRAAGSPEIRRAAQVLGQKIQSERGAETAAQIIAACFEAG